MVPDRGQNFVEDNIPVVLTGTIADCMPLSLDEASTVTLRRGNSKISATGLTSNVSRDELTFDGSLDQAEIGFWDVEVQFVLSVGLFVHDLNENFPGGPVARLLPRCDFDFDLRTGLQEICRDLD